VLLPKHPLHCCRSKCFRSGHAIKETIFSPRRHCTPGALYTPCPRRRPARILFRRCIDQSLHLSRCERFRICHAIKKCIGCFAGSTFRPSLFWNLALSLGCAIGFSIGQSVENFGRYQPGGGGVLGLDRIGWSNGSTRRGATPDVSVSPLVHGRGLGVRDGEAVKDAVVAALLVVAIVETHFKCNGMQCVWKKRLKEQLSLTALSFYVLV
jgi:hypothetical protein